MKKRLLFLILCLQVSLHFGLLAQNHLIGSYDVYFDNLKTEHCEITNTQGKYQILMNGTTVPLEIRGKTLVATENGEEMVILSVADRTEIHWAGQVMELRRVQSSGAKSIDGNFFLGQFVMDFNGQELGKVTITSDGGKYYSINLPDGTKDLATLVGQALEGESNGLPFRIIRQGNNLSLEVQGNQIALKRISTTSSSAGATGNSGKKSDAFVGNYELVVNQKNLGAVKITKIDATQYQLSSSDGQSDIFSIKNNTLTGTSNGIAFVIAPEGNQLKVSFDGGTGYLVRSGATPKATGTVDNRLLGRWVGSSSINSSGGVGSASMAFGRTYFFAQDGTYQTKSTSAGGGADWSTSSEGKVEYGRYQIVSKNESGGVVSVNGNELKYVFYDDFSKMKLGNMHYEKSN